MTNFRNNGKNIPVCVM